jgi:hypothetical protein
MVSDSCSRCLWPHLPPTWGRALASQLVWRKTAAPRMCRGSVPRRMRQASPVTIAEHSTTAATCWAWPFSPGSLASGRRTLTWQQAYHCGTARGSHPIRVRHAGAVAAGWVASLATTWLLEAGDEVLYGDGLYYWWTCNRGKRVRDGVHPMDQRRWAVIIVLLPLAGECGGCGRGLGRHRVHLRAHLQSKRRPRKWCSLIPWLVCIGSILDAWRSNPAVNRLFKKVHITNSTFVKVHISSLNSKIRQNTSLNF